MLDELRIRGLGIIDDVTLVLGPGLNVLTGETGAGKTMVVSALELLLGARADADRVRGGADAAVVEARLHPVPAAADEWAEEGDDDLVVMREVLEGRDGTRSRARVGGRLAPASALGDVMAAVVELHGQADTPRLGDPATQRDLLDSSGGAALASAKEVYAAAFERWRDAEQELRDLEAEGRDRARELDRLRFELDEIDAVGPAPGEDLDLDRAIAIGEHAERLVEAARAAADALVAEAGARDGLGATVNALRRIAGVDPRLDDLRARVEGLAAETQDAALELRAHADEIDLDPARLDALRERRMTIAGLTRKYGPDADAVIAYATDARARAERLAGGQERAERLASEVEALRRAAEQAADELSAARRTAAARLASEIERHLAELAMEAATVVVDVERSELRAHGGDRVTFRLAANPGEALLPLAKAASGGERSRIALAVRLALADADETPVLVFDEIDAGIGGAAAQTVGRKLAALARGRQVLCVTHLAQLAAFADAHFVVDKAAAEGRTVARVRRLEEAERVRELSRMLSGTPDSDAAAEHAAELLDSARASA